MKPNLDCRNLSTRKYATVRAGEFPPMCVLTPGGTGSRVARELKVRLEASDIHAVPILYIDSGSREGEKHLEFPTPHEPVELVLLNPLVGARSLMILFAARIIHEIFRTKAAFNDSHKIVVRSSHSPGRAVFTWGRRRIVDQDGRAERRHSTRYGFLETSGRQLNFNAPNIRCWKTWDRPRAGTPQCSLISALTRRPERPIGRPRHQFAS